MQEHISGWKIESIAAGEKVKARKFSYSSQLYLLMLPHLCVVGKACDHDSKKEGELFNSLEEGDVGIVDRVYNHFKVLHRQSLLGVFFVVREKSGMKYRIVKWVAEKDLGENVISDEMLTLTIPTLVVKA